MSELEEDYRERYEAALKPISEELEKDLRGCLSEVERIDRITVRPKSVDKFLRKAQKCADGVPKYSDPLRQIQDQIGARIVIFYKDDVNTVESIIRAEFTPIELQDIVPDSESEFGYIGRHFILLVPEALKPENVSKDVVPRFFELQIKTLFQHAWAEANHDLAYKPSDGLTSDQRRKVAFTAAQAWGADEIFNELQQELGSS